MRVSELLDLELLENAGVTVVAGADHLDREVRWVHTGEIADIAQYLSGGEVLLTAATGLLGGSKADRRRYIRELGEVGAACVILELVRSFREVPPEMVEEAEKHDLVLVTLDREVPFVAVTHQAHTELVSSAHVALERAIAIDDALSALILEGASLPAVLELMAERLNNPVILEDGARRVVGYGRAAGTVAPILRAWQTHSRQGHAHDRTAAVQQAHDPQRCTWTTITVRGETWGRLHVLEVDSRLDDVARLTLGRAAASIALYLMAERDAALSDAAEHSLIGGLALADGFNGQEFLARASGLGVDLDGNLVMIVAGEAGDDPDAAGSRVAALRAALRDVRWPSLVGSLEGRITAVATARPAGGLAETTESVVAALDGGPLAGCHLGVSRPCRASQLPRAEVEAGAAERLGPSSGEGRVHFYDDLVLYRLLSPLSAGPTLANFVGGELGPLIEHDDRHRSELLRTLDAYLQANGNKIVTAQKLHLQRRSVYYRLERIEQLLGRSLDDPEQRVRLYVALRAHEMLGREPTVQSAP
jgi:PucR family transcriptional regulator, purine catabolism regulatory protein